MAVLVAHLKRQLTGHGVIVAVTNGRLDLGTWERILCQLDGWPVSLDGRRRKRVLVKIIGE